MKKLVTALVCIICITPIFYSQTNWYIQNSGTNSILQDVFFVDQDYGWIAGAQLILHTTDGGNTWVEQPAPPVSLFYVSIFFTDRMTGWACGNEAKIIHTTDGGNTWVSQSNPYITFNPILYGIYFVNPDTGWAAGGDHGSYPTFINRRVILHTTNGGTAWDFQFDQSGEWPFYCINFSSSSDGYAAGQFGGIVRTTDGGNNWSEKTPITSYQPFSMYFMNSDIGWVSGEYLGVPHVSFISETIDGGNTWNTQTFGTDEYLPDIYFIDENTGWAVGGTIGGSGGSQHATILHTTDAGANWESETSPTTSTLLGLNFSPENIGWAVGTDGVVITTLNPVPVELTSFTAEALNNNIELNWQTASETNNRGFEIKRNQKSNPPAGEAGGKSQKEWERIGFVGGHGTTTKVNNYTYTDENLEAGKYSYRLVQVDFDGTRNELEVVTVEIINQPQDYTLKQNYPNPFNPSTLIEYSTTRDEHISLKVYNNLGEEVKTLVDGFEYAGTHKVIFIASGLSSGTYYYKISSPEKSIVRKMILLK